MFGITKIVSIFTATVLGISQSCQPIFGYNYGAKNYTRVKETIRVILVIATIISLVSEALFQFFPHQILGIFQHGDDLYLCFGAGYLRVFMGATCLNGATVSIFNFFPSIGMAKEGLIASLSRQMFFRLPLILLFPLLWGLNGVLYAGLVADVRAAILCVLLVCKRWAQLS